MAYLLKDLKNQLFVNANCLICPLWKGASPVQTCALIKGIIRL